jgi:MEMO1 family protein
MLGGYFYKKKPKPPADSKNVRLPAMADRFYPGDPVTLRKTVEHHLRHGLVSIDEAPKAIIAPHAAYIYSGPIAGSAYAPLAHKNEIRRVVLIGPSHYMAIYGMGLSGVTAWQTPLGTVPVDAEAKDKLLSMSLVHTADVAHAREHCLEVQVPFLQRSLKNFQIVPLLAGRVEDVEVTRIIEALWGGPETLFVISTDLSHYLDYESARRIDEKTAKAIEQLRPMDIANEQCCGSTGVRGFLWAARNHHLRVVNLDVRNSGDSSGRHDQVVGYGAFAFLPGKDSADSGRPQMGSAGE